MGIRRSHLIPRIEITNNQYSFLVFFFLRVIKLVGMGI